MIRIGSLFTGIAGLDRGVEQALAQLGQPSRVEWQAEKDPYARAVLAKHYPAVRRYEDVRDVDAHAPPVDLLEGGFPCQDLSLAGKREGITGARSGLWSEFERGIRVLRPDLVFVENVPELAAYLGHVLGPLVELGFDAEWGLFSAAEVGAPHRRERMFILAHARGYRFPDPQQQVAGLGESAGPRNDGRPRPLPHADGVRLAGGVAGGVAAEVAAIARPVLADADGGRKLQPAVPEQAVGSRPRDGGEAVAHALRPRRPRPQDGAHERRERPSISGAHVGDAEGQRRDAAGGSRVMTPKCVLKWPGGKWAIAGWIAEQLPRTPQLLDALDAHAGPVALSHYRCGLYDKMLERGWAVETISTVGLPASRTRIPCQALFLSLPGRSQRSNIAQQLGVPSRTDGGLEHGDQGKTRVRGVYVIGDASKDVTFAIVAAAEGAVAAAAVDHELRMEGVV